MGLRAKEFLERHEMDPAELEKRIQEAMGGEDEASIQHRYEESIRHFEPGRLLKGMILEVVRDEVLVDVGYKSEGVLSVNEFGEDTPAKVGATVEVLLESVEDDTGLIVISKRKADRQRAWESILQTHKEGDVVRGKVMRKIKGGLLVDIGVPAFLPASQVNLRRSGDITDWIGKEVESRIIKIDEDRQNIVVSRRKLMEEQREIAKQKLLAEVEEGQVRRGIVKNLADFGAFVDLGGIDGLLHITDIAWKRVNHPSDVLKPEQIIEVVVLKVDKDRERIALGLKQRTPSPWESVEVNFPVGKKVRGRVVNIVPYGAFVEIEEGIEGLVHISEMSWTKRVNHPSEIVKPGDEVDVVILDINRDKQEISLGMKQAGENPWDLVQDKFPIGTIVEGPVRNLTNYGAFVELEEGIDGLLHVSDMSWTKKVNHPSEIVNKGDTVKAIVLSVDQDKRRIALGLKQLEEDPWESRIPDKYRAGDVLEGSVTKVTNFGAFVELEPNLEGLLHVSEYQDRNQAIEQGDKVLVEILRVEAADRKIGLRLAPAGALTSEVARQMDEVARYALEEEDPPEAKPKDGATKTADDGTKPEGEVAKPEGEVAEAEDGAAEAESGAAEPEGGAASAPEPPAASQAGEGEEARGEEAKPPTPASQTSGTETTEAADDSPKEEGATKPDATA